MSEKPDLTRLHSRRFNWGLTPLAAAFLILVVAAAGCGTDDLVITQFSPSLVSATAPDSIAPGAPLQLKVHWRRTNSCQGLKDVEVVALNESTFTITVLGEERRESGTNCLTETSIEEHAFLFENPPAGPFTMEVFGARERFELTVQGDAAPAAIERHHVLVRDATKLQNDEVEGATVNIRNLSDGSLVAALTTGADGVADTALACPPGGARGYLLEVDIPTGRGAVLEYRDFPARCRIPEWCSIRL
jgi:hypothetical protein